VTVADVPVEETDACFITNGQRVAYVFE